MIFSSSPIQNGNMIAVPLSHCEKSAPTLSYKQRFSGLEVMEVLRCFLYRQISLCYTVLVISVITSEASVTDIRLVI